MWSPPRSWIPRGVRRGTPHQNANPPHLTGLLPARRERPRGCRATEQRDEIAPFQLSE